MLATLAVLTTLTWADVPALVDGAAAPIDAELRACTKHAAPWSIVLIIMRDPKTGASTVQMPFPNVGIRGFTAEETCLMKAIPKIAVPELPAGIDRIDYLHTVVAAGGSPPAVDKAFDDWRDPATTLATKIDLKTLAACTKTKRTARVTIDLTHGKTRIWLPAWQFHSPSGDGSTPKPEQRVKACMTKAIASWKLPVLPKQMGQLDVHFAIP